MKVLKIDAAFILPDDFDGTLDDALLLFFDKVRSTDPLPEQLDASFNVSSHALFYNARRGFKAVAKTVVWRESETAWERMSEDPPACYSFQGAWIK